MATGLALRGVGDRQVVAIIGDGSLTGGMAYEGLNNLGHSGRKVVIVLNDNGRSYAPTVSKLSESLTWLRLHPTFVRQRARLERLLQSVPRVGDRLERVAESAEAAVRELWEPPAFFEQLGVRYTGPIDGHDVEAVERALTHAAEWDGPIVVHVRTQKGRGHAPALADEVKRLHDIGGVKADSYTQTFSDAVIKAAEADDRVVAITAAMPDSTGLLPFGERFPDRFFDVGIAEQHAVTAAAGMAMAGLRPVVAIYSTFLTRAFDQVNLDVGLHRQPVVFAVDRAGITGDDGASHHGVLDLALLTKVPGMTVLAPSSAQELSVMFEDALAVTDGPVAIRFPKTTARAARPDQVGTGLRARRAREGDGSLAILAVGKLLAAAEEAADVLAAEGVSATVWDVRVCKPLDGEMLADAARHGVVVTAEDGIREGGVGSAIAEALAEGGPVEGAPRVLVLGTPVEFLPHGKPDAILAQLGLDGAGIAATARRALGAPAASR
jgi:1-deoxy-D-xylulose-5-phosphate synthase